MKVFYSHLPQKEQQWCHDYSNMEQRGISTYKSGIVKTKEWFIVPFHLQIAQKDSLDPYRSYFYWRTSETEISEWMTE